MTTNTLCPSVFDAGLPSLEYEFAEPPATVYPGFGRHSSRRR